MIKKIPFKINYPLNILKEKKVDFENMQERNEILQRNIYHKKYGKKENSLLKKRTGDFIELAKNVLTFINKKYPKLKPLNISVFGSALFSENSEDFDFLVIVKGNSFLLEETLLDLNGKEVKAGISIKGLENFSSGINNPNIKIPTDIQMDIIHRTAVSLYRRHLPVWGYDFVDNENVFLDNIYAQVSDLLINAYKDYHLGQSEEGLSLRQRSKKILSRLYEAISYIMFLVQNKEIKYLRKVFYLARERKENFDESKKHLEKFIKLYQKRLKNKVSINFRGENDK